MPRPARSRVPRRTRRDSTGSTAARLPKCNSSFAAKNVPSGNPAACSRTCLVRVCVVMSPRGGVPPGLRRANLRAFATMSKTGHRQRFDYKRWDAANIVGKPQHQGFRMIGLGDMPFRRSFGSSRTAPRWASTACRQSGVSQQDMVQRTRAKGRAWNAAS